MKEFLQVYSEVIQTNHDLAGQVIFEPFGKYSILMIFIFQVHNDFKSQCLELTVDKLMEVFCLSKYTGLEKPSMSFIFGLFNTLFT